MSLNHISILSVPVSDQERSKAFYTDIIGFEMIHEQPMEHGLKWVQLGLPGAEASIALVTWQEKMPTGSLQGVVINTDDIEKAQKTLKARGLDITDVDKQPWGQFATFDDPDGNGWVLQQMPEDC